MKIIFVEIICFPVYQRVQGNVHGSIYDISGRGADCTAKHLIMDSFKHILLKQIFESHEMFLIIMILDKF